MTPPMFSTRMTGLPNPHKMRRSRRSASERQKSPASGVRSNPSPEVRLTTYSAASQSVFSGGGRAGLRKGVRM